MNPDQIKAIQSQAKAQGLYDGPIDGVMGPKTQAAFAALQSRNNSQAEAQKAAAQAEAAKSQAEGQKAAAAAAAQQAAAQNAATELQRQQFEANKSRQDQTDLAKNKANEWANSPAGIAYNFGTKIAPYGAGEVGGYLFGGTKVGAVGASQTSKNAALQKMVSEGLGPESLNAAKTAGLIPASSSVMRAGSRMAPLAFPGLLLGGAGQILRSDALAPSDETQLGGDLRRGMGGLVQGTGAGLITRSLESAFAPKVAPDASAIDKIMAASRAPAEDEAGAAANAARAEGMRQARMAEISNKTVAQLQDELRAAKAKVSGVKADLADRVYTLRYGGQQIAEEAAANVGRKALTRVIPGLGVSAALLAAFTPHNADASTLEKVGDVANAASYAVPGIGQARIVHDMMRSTPQIPEDETINGHSIVHPDDRAQYFAKLRAIANAFAQNRADYNAPRAMLNPQEVAEEPVFRPGSPYAPGSANVGRGAAYVGPERTSQYGGREALIRALLGQ